MSEGSLPSSSLSRWKYKVIYSDKARRAAYDSIIGFPQKDSDRLNRKVLKESQTKEGKVSARYVIESKGKNTDVDATLLLLERPGSGNANTEGSSLDLKHERNCTQGITVMFDIKHDSNLHFDGIEVVDIKKAFDNDPLCQKWLDSNESTLIVDKNLSLDNDMWDHARGFYFEEPQLDPGSFSHTFEEMTVLLLQDNEAILSIPDVAVTVTCVTSIVGGFEGYKGYKT